MTLASGLLGFGGVVFLPPLLLLLLKAVGRVPLMPLLALLLFLFAMRSTSECHWKRGWEEEEEEEDLPFGR